MVLGCSFITCAVKKNGVEFCWDCIENLNCLKWATHREAGAKYDSFKCYQKLEEDVGFIRENSLEEYKRLQNIREKILKDMLDSFNEGRSKRRSFKKLLLHCGNCYEDRRAERGTNYSQRKITWFGY